MVSNVISEDTKKSSVPGLETLISVVISNYPLANGGYLVSFGKDDPDQAFTKYDPFSSMDFYSSKLSDYLDFDSMYLPEGCFYLPETKLTGFIRSLASGASVFRVRLLPATSREIQALLLIMVDEDSLSTYEQKEKE